MKVCVKKTYFVALCMLSVFATLLTSLNTSLKIIPIIAIYILFYRYYIRYKSYVKLSGIYRLIFVAYICYCILLILRSIFFDSNSGLLGNFLLSLFGNLEFGILPLSLPIFAVIVCENNIWKSYAKACRIISVCGIMLGCLYLLNIDITLGHKIFYLVPVVCPVLLLENKHKKEYMLYFLLSLFYCHNEDERSIMIMEILSMSVIVFWVYFKQRKIILKCLKIYTIIVPLIGGSLTSVNLLTGDSIFTLLENSYGKKSTLVQDTRTFLFIELREDLSSTDSWMFGKGIFGTYYSQVMHNALMRKDYSDNENRLGTECGYLWLLLKGGIIYCLLYFFLFYISILKGCKYNDAFTMALAFIIANRLLLMFISFTPALDISNMFTWLFVTYLLQYKPQNKKEQTENMKLDKIK